MLVQLDTECNSLAHTNNNGRPDYGTYIAMSSTNAVILILQDVLTRIIFELEVTVRSNMLR